MRKMLGAMSAALCLIITTPLYAHATELITKPEASTEETSEAVLAEIESSEPIAYFNDKDWNEFYAQALSDYERGLERGLYGLYVLIISKQLSYDQLHQVLEDGYFLEYIDAWKTRGILDKDYKLPEDVKDSGFKIKRDEQTELKVTTSDDDTIEKHQLSELRSDEAEKTIIGFYNDNVMDNAFIYLPSSTKDQTIDGEMIKFSALMGEPLLIIFMNDKEDRADYSWYFKSVVYYPEQALDLKVEFNDETLKFDLTDTLPAPATLTLYTGREEGMALDLMDKTGETKLSLPVDEDGFVSMEVDKDGDYQISYRKITISGDKTSTEDEENKKEVTNTSTKNNIGSNIPVLVFVILMCTVGMVLFVLAFTIKWKPKKHK
ncbi:hypothetical protein bpr_II340 (plasmid) [Butyrivibrio proteoclasticus B316]|uniref:Uncharacterized protein n=1 Tax=Butyrivibrio proteoclasticus (strain ATCC 51982 / DSM 14932 / B316) TaxID=515622 RepID=E0S4E5_BUTPB|nr:hypothetical protein [Butyrivibrio proteoclasticus]ADL36277.1 hypothetical protein bpr_II340 [Butyrivibrio proteoclasticus B316]